MVFIASMQGCVTLFALESAKLWCAHGANSILSLLHDLPYLRSAIDGDEAAPLHLIGIDQPVRVVTWDG
jgi:hypothetical protein